VPGSKRENYMTHDLERKVEEQQVKQNTMHFEEEI
jgi:hypothetical protein